MLRRIPRLARTTLLAAALAAGCGDDGGGGGTVIVALRSDLSGINSITNSSLYTFEIINFALFTPLVRYDENLRVQPWLAESWTEEGDSAIVMHLRGDLLWHDGMPVTAHDVKFTFDRMKMPETASSAGSAFLGNIAAAETLDSLTIRFRYARPHAQAIEDFFWSPMPRHLLEAIPPAELRNAPFNRKPIGNGPFRFVEWLASERLVLVRNPDYPAALGGPAVAERVVIRIIPEAATRLTELLTGGIHADIDVLPDQAAGIEQQPGIRLHAYPGSTVYYVGWNNARPPFNDARVRRALTLAMNRGEIIDALLRGHGSPATSPIPPWHPLHPADVERPGHAPEEAARLLEAAGYRDRNGDGIRENAQGQPLRFTLISSDDPLRRSVVEVLQSQFRAVGADAEIRTMEFQTMLDRHRGRDFDAVFTNWVLDNFQMAAAPYALLHSSLADVAESTNRSSVRSARIDALIGQGAAATDAAEQARVWAELTRALNEEQPLTFMFWIDELVATSMRLSGVTMDQRGELRTLRDWSLGGG